MLPSGPRFRRLAGCVRCFAKYAEHMNDVRALSIRPLRWVLPALLVLLLAGCATHPKIDWAGRIGNYTYDQAVMDYGPPDKQAKLSDHSLVAEWQTQRPYAYAFPAYGYYGWGYPWYWGPFYPPYNTVYSPGCYLRLIFDPDGKLTAWKNFSH